MTEKEAHKFAEGFTHGESLALIKGFLIWAYRNKCVLKKVKNGQK